MEVFTLKKYLFVLLAIVLLFAISACSEKDNSTEPQILGYLLEQFVEAQAIHQITDPSSPDSLDFRGLYNYEIVAADDYSPRDRTTTAGYDLDWAVFKTGYMVPAEQFRTRFLDGNTPGAFSVTNANRIRVYRRIVVEDSLGSGHYKELRALPIHSVENWDGIQEEAIKLSDLISDHSGFSYIMLVAADGFARGYSPEQIADGYYLLESERTTFPSFNAEMSNSLKRFKYVDRIQLNMAFGATLPQYLNADNTEADLSITLPELYDAYNATVLENN